MELYHSRVDEEREAHGIYTSENAIADYELGIENGLTSVEVYYRTALIYDSAGKQKDIEKAYRYYRFILEMFPDFELYQEVEQRVQFMEKNFFNYE